MICVRGARSALYACPIPLFAVFSSACHGGQRSTCATHQVSLCGDAMLTHSRSQALSVDDDHFQPYARGLRTRLMLTIGRNLLQLKNVVSRLSMNDKVCE